ncbi:uncharacterized protein LOC123259133 [Cotesia glomerata]|uniref:Uncharacterized protein n=1 Tax=Cotesia glomerata TaxID=32391 RepID=A0AAV7HGD9_COTGL|nr:uncharacterized protein LOC123259133 [Cotesia glomerata]KAH0539191.1 hypothetical protein KQX54_001839 [Cotesia glomerata]
MDSKLFCVIISAMCALQLVYSSPLYDENEKFYTQDEHNIKLYFAHLYQLGRIFFSDLQFIREQIVNHPNSTMSDLETDWKKFSKKMTDIKHNDNIRPIDLLLKDIEKIQNGIADYQNKVALIKEKTSDADNTNTPVKELLEAMLKE